MEAIDYRGFEGIHGPVIVYRNEKTTKLQNILNERHVFPVPKNYYYFLKGSFLELKRCLHLTNSKGERNIEMGLQIMIKFIKQGDS